MTQALAVRDFLEAAGHRVTVVLLGTSRFHEVPPYFKERLRIPVHTHPALTLVPDRASRGVNARRSVVNGLGMIPRLVMGGFAMRRTIRAHRPDVVVNFFDFVAGFVDFFSWRPPGPPRVALAHAYLLGHPDAAPSPPDPVGHRGLSILSTVAAAGAGRPLALSFDALPDTPRVRVVPPLLRPGLDALRLHDGGYLLAYALNGGYARDVADWQARNPSVEVHCYVSGGGRGLGIEGGAGFHLHALDDLRFLEHLAGCRAFVGTAGFEAVCEAFYLGKPILAIPVDDHFEQAFNAADMRRTGIANTGSFQDLDAFWNALRPPSEERVRTFRSWVARAPELIVGAIEEAARRGAGSPPGPLP